MRRVHQGRHEVRSEENRLEKIEEMDYFIKDSASDIAQFFDGRSIFITGATGFVGKALVEKMLRSCPGVKTIYILVRPKPGAPIESRLEQIFHNSLFDQVKHQSQALISKVIPIEGDISLPGLGICNDDRKRLMDEVSIVVHSAATVKFVEKLKVSIQLNVQGTRGIIELCKQMKGLEAMVQVSTAYSNCERSHINEAVYPLSADPAELLKRLEAMSDSELDTRTHELIESRPNTYTYTKAMAETFLEAERGNLPISIVRPSIVTATWKEPVPGWVDNMSGLTGFLAAWGKGVMKTGEVHGDKVADLIPVDLLVNMILAAAWNTATTNGKTLNVYNCCSGDRNPVTWGELTRECNASLFNNAYEGTLWYPHLSLQSNHTWSRIADALYHWLPAQIMDLVSFLLGEKQKGMRVYRSLARALATIQYFTTHQWNFPSNNVTRLYSALSSKDQEVFNFNLKGLDWSKYLDAYCLGVREHILKQDASTIPESRRRVRMKYWIVKLFQILSILLCVLIVFNNNSFGSNLVPIL